MPMLNFHPSPGLGDLLPGWYTVPQNPLRPDSTPLVPTVSAAVGNRITRKPTMGDILPGSFTVPQNPLVRSVPGGMEGLGCGCGCASGPPAVAMGHIVDVPGSNPYRYAWPQDALMTDSLDRPISMYEVPTSEDMNQYGMAGFNMDGQGLLGTGLFENGANPSTWGGGEWAVALLGAYTVYSVMFTTRTAVRQTRSTIGGAVRGARGGMRSRNRR